MRSVVVVVGKEEKMRRGKERKDDLALIKTRLISCDLYMTFELGHLISRRVRSGHLSHVITVNQF